MTDWVVPFYARQDELSGVYSGEPSDADLARVAAIARLAGPGQKRILELGAGGGQTAAAAAAAGHEVVAVELVPSAAGHARELAASRPEAAMTVVEGDFFEVEPGGSFDVVCYWDGFGVGDDADQRRLLRRVAGWLVPDGCALLDVNTPWYWAAAAGQERRFPGAVRRYGYDADGNRMLDTWWDPDDAGNRVTQSLRCYAPADLRLLLEETGLALVGLEPGGAVDAATGQYSPEMPLAQAMQYLAKLALADSRLPAGAHADHAG